MIEVGHDGAGCVVYIEEDWLLGGGGGCFGEEEGGGYGGAADVVAEGCEEG